MPNAITSDLLELSDFEYVTYLDDTAEYPMVMVLRLHLDGSLQTQVFRQALQQALNHHPLLRSGIQRRRRRLYWQPADHTPPLVITHSCTPDDNCPPRRFQLESECGSAFDLRVGPDRSVLVCHFHHACVDGVGAIRFLADVFALYGQFVSAAGRSSASPPPEFVAPEPRLLNQRGACPDFGAQTGERKPWFEWLRGPARFLLGNNYCIPNLAETEPNSEHAPANILHTAVIDRPVVRKLKQLAAVKGVSTNDLCMMVYLQQIASWTGRHRAARDNDLFRVLMPVSLRTPELDQISAANVLSYVYQTFRRRHCRNAEALLSSVHRRSSNMLLNNEAAIFLKLFRLVRRFPFLMVLSRRLQPAFATAVLANVGELKRIFGQRFPLQRGRVVAGDVVIRRIDGIAPLRKHTNVAISFGGYGGQLILNLRANPECLSSQEASAFLQQVVARLTQMARRQSITAGRISSDGAPRSVGHKRSSQITDHASESAS